MSAESSRLEIVDHAQRAAEAAFSNQCSAMAMGTADMVLIPVLPDRQSVIEGMRAAKHVASFSKASRREIPFRIVLSH